MIKPQFYCLVLALLGQVCHAAGGISSSFLNPTLAPASAVWGLAGDEYRRYQQAKKDAGQLVLDQEGYETDQGTEYAAVYQKNVDKRGWISRRDMSESEFENLNRFYRQQGLRLIDQDIYLIDDKKTFSAAWIQNQEKLWWFSKWHLSPHGLASLQQRFESHSIPIDVEGYINDQKLEYGLIWLHNKDNLKWALKVGMKRAEYDHVAQDYKNQGYRILDFESYTHDGAQLYAAIWIQQASNNRWKTHSDLTKSEYQHRWEALNNAGYRLTDFERYTGPNGPRYAGVWRKKSKQIYLISQAHKGRTR